MGRFSASLAAVVEAVNASDEYSTSRVFTHSNGRAIEMSRSTAMVARSPVCIQCAKTLTKISLKQVERIP